MSAMADDFEQRFPANHRQAAYWNVDIAQKWIDHQAALDLRFRAITDLLIERARPAPGERVIDVGCGTGATLLAVAPRVTPGGSVLGVDISAPMLEVARRRVGAAGLSPVEFAQVDVQTHRFEPHRFDLALSRFGVMFFSDPVAAFTNLRSALRPGGRLAFVCWTDLGTNPFFCLPLEVAVRRLGPEEEERSPRAPGPFAFSEADYVHEILAAARFQDIRIDRVEAAIETPTGPDEEAAFACNIGPAARLVRERSGDDPEAAIAALQPEIAAALARFATADGMRIPAIVSMVTAHS